MARLSGEIAVSGSVVSPIVGNINLGGGCYDPSTGKALWGVLNGSAFEVWRTIGDYRTLVTGSGSVEHLSTIDAGPWWTPATVALQRIGGSLYANVSGRRASGAGAGQWIYRDTSVAQDGSGPWVKHGTVHEIAAYSTVSLAHLQGGNVGGEIVVEGGLWATNCVIFADFGNAYSINTQGVATSSDGGVTWTIRLNVGWYQGGRYGVRWSRNFAKFGGAWYVGGAGSEEPGKNYKSSNLTSWTSVGDLGFTAGEQGTSYPIYTGSRIYRYAHSFGVSGTLQSAAAAPELLPTWRDEFSTSPMEFSGAKVEAFPYICNIGPNNKPLWAVCGWGQILALETIAGIPPCRQWPRADGRAASSARRRYPIDKSEQASPRRAGHYW